MSVLFGLIAFVGMAATQPVAWTCDKNTSLLQFTPTVSSADYKASNSDYCTGSVNGTTVAAYVTVSRDKVCTGYDQCLETCSKSDANNAAGWNQCAKDYDALNVSLAVCNTNLTDTTQELTALEAKYETLREENSRLRLELRGTQDALDACNKRADHEEAEEKECRKQNREIKENVAKLLKLLKKKECGLDFCRANELACDERGYQ